MPGPPIRLARLRGTRLTVRLTVLLLVPVAAFGAVSARVAYGQYSVLEQAEDVQAQAEELSSVGGLAYVLSSGLAWPANRDQIDRALDQISEPGLRASLTEKIFAPGANRIASEREVLRSMDTLGSELLETSDGLAHTSGVLRQVMALQAAYQAASLQARLSVAARAVMGGHRITDGERAVLLEYQARYTAFGDTVVAFGGPSVQDYWKRMSSSSAMRTLNAVVDGETPGPLTARQVMQTTAALEVEDGERDRLHAEVINLAAAQVARDAAQLRARNGHAFYLALLQVLLVGIGMALAALLLARSVTRPLRRVADRARRMQDGDLAVLRTHAPAPAEIAMVTDAFDDLADNVTLVGDQLAALAAGEVEHESLKRTGSGRIGANLKTSVRRLTRSLEARAELESQLRHESTHDRLSGLLNRSSAIVALEQGVARVHRVGGGLAVLSIDLDGLNRVNATFGHATGDEVLRQVAGRIAASVRGGDIVARLGADEFVVIAEVDGIAEAVELAERVVETIATTSVQPISGPGPAVAGAGAAPVSVGGSVGIGITLDGLATPAELMRDAEAAVRRAKAGGGNRIDVFDEALRRQLAYRSSVESALSAAMERGDLRLVYQPITDTSGRVAGLEALCRWVDPELGEVPPTTFVGIAETSTLVVELDRWVFKEAARQMARWQADGLLKGAYLSVNLSGRHLLDPGVVGDVQEALDSSGLDPARLVVEITETVLLDDFLLAADHLEQLRRLGVRVAVDDFGTGFTSVAHLQKLPVDVLKMDRSFIVDLGTERGRSLVRLMVDMAATLHLGLVAEGVETSEQLKQLRAMDCPLIQGHLLGRPMVPDQLRRWASTADLLPAV
ncbi:putative bifunctional diguanylate cyclase/phosphodiesterase [Spongisporangium articulatum]|uniref:Bifunctional diguanylate cyclase/phosphodiesterase n=1 Tax=Spongisporangium articulatum TaxID=3362603 RepID=A0ABW8ASS7_9ACTN